MKLAHHRGGLVMVGAVVITANFRPHRCRTALSPEATGTILVGYEEFYNIFPVIKHPFQL
jgi:hypothetical protein